MARVFQFSAQPALDEALRERDEAGRQLEFRRAEWQAATEVWTSIDAARAACAERLSRLGRRAESGHADPVLVAADGMAHRREHETLIAWEDALAEQAERVAWASDRLAAQREAVREALARVESLEALREAERRHSRMVAELLEESQRDEASIAAWRLRTVHDA